LPAGINDVGRADSRDACTERRTVRKSIRLICIEPPTCRTVQVFGRLRRRAAFCLWTVAILKALAETSGAPASLSILDLPVLQTLAISYCSAAKLADEQPVAFTPRNPGIEACVDPNLSDVPQRLDPGLP
jgi:hypothetical protein